jgi:zinc/manganese transport system substrate-binding protein
MRRLVILLALIAPSLPAGAAPLKVVASFSILGDLAAEIGGDRVAVETLVGPDADAHGFEPRPSDARKLAGAALLVVNGLGFDGWADRLAASAAFHGVRVVASAAVRPIRQDGATDPHAWQSPTNAALYVDQIVDGLSRAEPQAEGRFRSEGEAYKARLRDLDREIRAALAPIPPARRAAIVPHRAFDYFGLDYGIAFLAPVGTDADADPSAGAVADLVRAARAGHVAAVFAEHLGNEQLVRRIAAEAGLAVAGELYSDALSQPGGPAPTYIDLMRGNARLIATALATPPEATPPR